MTTAQANEAAAELPKLLGISERQFRGYRYAQKKSKAYNMDLQKLVLLADYFKLTINDLVV